MDDRAILSINAMAVCLAREDEAGAERILSYLLEHLRTENAVAQRETTKVDLDQQWRALSPLVRAGERLSDVLKRVYAGETVPDVLKLLARTSA